MLSITELFALTFRLYRTNLGIYLGYSAWLLIPAVGFGILQATESTNVLLFGFQIATIIFSVFVWIMLCLITADVLQKKPIHQEQISQKAWSLLPQVVFVGCLAAIAKIVGFVFFIVPGILFCVWYAFAGLEVALGGQKGLQALAASRELVRGRFGATLWRLFGGMLVLLLSYSLFASLLISGLELLTTGTATIGSMEPSIAANAFGAMVDVLALPIFVIYPLLIYTDLRSTKKSHSASPL